MINDDLFAAGQVITISGTVNGDVFAGSETTNIDGIINGNLHIGASRVNLSGKIKGNVYIGAGSLNVNKSAIGGSLIIGSGDVSLDKDTTIGGSLIAGAGNISLDATIKRNAVVGAGSITVGPNTKISKDLYYAVGNNQKEIIVPSTAVISGSIHKSSSEFNTPNIEAAKKEFTAAAKTARVFALVGGFLSALLVGYLYLHFFKNQLVRASDLVGKSFWKSFGIGFVIIIMALPALVILLITLVGVPLAGILFLILLIYLYLAKIVVGFAVGKWLVEKLKWSKVSEFLALALGLLAIYILKIVPVVNVFFGIIVLWSGLGALAITFTSKKD